MDSTVKTQPCNFLKPVHIDGKEYGEVYHIAAYLAADANHKANVIGGEDLKGYCDFLNNVSPGSTQLVEKQKGSNGPQITAKYFVLEKFREIEKRVSNKLMHRLSDVSFTTGDDVAPFSGRTRSCLLWVRSSSYKPERNMTSIAFKQLWHVLKDCGYNPIVIGNMTHFAQPENGENLIDFFNRDQFNKKPLEQILFLNHLCDQADVQFSIGMKSGAMDGLAFARGLKTIYFGHPLQNDRMNKVGSAFGAFVFVPVAYREKFTCFSKHELEAIYKIIDTGPDDERDGER